MGHTPFFVRVWGCRGSIATPGPTTVKYGGNTSCLEIQCGDEVLIFDAGTGIKNLGLKLLEERPKDLSIHLFLSHLHWDHIQGFPFFAPLYVPPSQCHLRVYGERKGRESFATYFSSQMKAPYFPMTFQKIPQKVLLKEIKPKQKFELGPDLMVSTFRAYHPNGCLSYRIQYRDKVISYITDAEMRTELLDQNLITAAHKADYVFCDGMYTADEYPSHVGWGHMSWNQAVSLTQEAHAQNLILWHHHHMHDDAFMERIEKEAQQLFASTLVAYEGLRIEL